MEKTTKVAIGKAIVGYAVGNGISGLLRENIFKKGSYSSLEQLGVAALASIVTVVALRPIERKFNNWSDEYLGTNFNDKPIENIVEDIESE